MCNRNKRNKKEHHCCSSGVQALPKLKGMNDILAMRLNYIISFLYFQRERNDIVWEKGTPTVTAA